MDAFQEIEKLLEKQKFKEAGKEIEKLNNQEHFYLHCLLQIKQKLSKNSAEDSEKSLNSLMFNQVKDRSQRDELTIIKDFIKADLKVLKNSTKEAIRDLNDLQQQFRNFPQIQAKILQIQNLAIPVSQFPEEIAGFLRLYRENSSQTDGSKWFVVSSDWFIKWKIYIGLSESVENQDLPFNLLWGNFSAANPGPVDNSSIIDSKNKDEFAKDEKTPGFYVLKPGLTENIDYVLVPEKAYELLRRKYNVRQNVVRYGILTGGTVKIEVYLKKVVIAFVLKEELQVKNYFTSRVSILLEAMIVAFKEINIKPPKTFEYVKILRVNTGNMATATLKQRVDSKKKPIFIENFKVLEETLTFDEAEISEDNFLFIDQRFYQDFLITADKTFAIPSDYCATCHKQSESLEKCKICAKFFCTKICRLSHSKQHKSKPKEKKRFFSIFNCFCKPLKQSDSEDEKKPLPINKASSMNSFQASTTSTSPSNSFLLGLKGLQNLGNTCFMNSAIQCLVHSEDLSSFFTSGAYLSKINKQNPLGTKGKLALAYGELITNMHSIKEKSFAPWGLKKTVAMVASQFEGYQQHDSHEFLSYLVNGLHEDLNEITKKPYYNTEIKLSNDLEVAEESWKRHLSRNKSVITELFYGQYKSTLKCPKCLKLSYAFDPFNCLSLPVPQNSLKKIEFFYVPYEVNSSILEISCFVEKNSKVCEIKKQVVEKCAKNMELLIFESKNKGVLKPVDDESNIAMMGGLYYVYEVPKETEYFVILVCKIENSNKEAHPRLLQVKNDVFSDIAEYFQKFLPVNLNSSQETLCKISPYSNHFNSCVLCGANSCKSCEITKSNAKLTSKIRNGQLVAMQITFSSLIKSKIDFAKLSSSKKSQTKEPGKGKISISDCFSAFSTSETLDKHNLWYCPTCKAHVQASKQLEIYRLPQILIIHLKRFRTIGHYREKLNVPIEFPKENLDISRFVIGSIPDLYDLYAVSNHYGTLSGGHYTATVQKSGKWYDCDDSHITEASEISESSAYVLFYRAKTR